MAKKFLGAKEKGKHDFLVVIFPETSAKHTWFGLSIDIVIWSTTLLLKSLDIC